MDGFNDKKELNEKFYVIAIDGTETHYDSIGRTKTEVYYVIECKKCGTKKRIRLQGIETASCISPTCRKPKNVFGQSHTRLHRIWSGIKGRCYCKTQTAYKAYGAKGITMCDEWRNDFKVFYNWAMTNGYNDELSIDRLESKGNYEPSNCRWATDRQQKNNRDISVEITVNGQTKTLADWADILNVPYSRLSAYRFSKKLRKTINEYIQQLLDKRGL